jgi:hypothetical protein
VARAARSRFRNDANATRVRYAKPFLPANSASSRAKPGRRIRAQAQTSRPPGDAHLLPPKTLSPKTNCYLPSTLKC